MTRLSSGSGIGRVGVPYARGALNTLPESALDELTLLTAHACNVPIVVISLLDNGYERFKAQVGVNVDQLPRDAAFSGPAIASGELVVITDACADSRLMNHPFVVSDPQIRFYAAAPLCTVSGQAFGALIIMDRAPRELSPIERNALLSLSRQVVALLDTRQSVATLRREPSDPQQTSETLAASETDFHLLAESLPQIVWVRGPDGSLQFVNRRGLEYTGVSFEQMSQQGSLTGFVHPEDRSRIENAWDDATAAAQGMGIEARLRRHDGVYRWYLFRALPVLDAQGKVVKWMGTSTDVHDVKESNDRSAFLLALSTELARISDPQDLVCTAMMRLRERLHTSRVVLAEVDDSDHEAIELSLVECEDSRLEVNAAPVEFFRHLATEAQEGLATVLCDARTDNRSASVYEDWYQPRGVCAIIAVPLLRGGQLVSLFSVVHSTPRDWTSSEIELVKRVADIVWPAFEKAHTDRTLVLSEERLRLAQGIARIGTWEWDPETNHCFISPEGHDLFGLPADKPHFIGDLLERVDSRDAQAVRSALDACLAGGTSEIEHRYRHPTRGMRWLHIKAGTALHAGRTCVVGIGLDVTERKRAEEALREVNQRKDEFLAMLAHELRNPLAPIRNAAQILRVYGKSNDQLDWARSVIERQARHLTRLVDDLLDVSRIVRGQIALERTNLDVNDIVQSAVETSLPLVRERGHRLKVTTPALPIHVEGDLTRLAQVIANLLNNAAKYTNEGGEIHVTAAQEGNRAVVRVRDSGVGIPQALLPHVFDLFTQGERTLDRSQGGLGIGLTLVKRIVDLHGGEVEAASAGPGQGSTFTVRLPAIELSEGLAAVEPHAAEAAQPGHLRILVVDDNVDAAESIAMLLSLDGHEVRSVHDAHGALEAASAFRPDVVLLDIGLPGMDGYEVARRLRSKNEVQGMRLVAVTGYGQQEDRDRTRDAGFDQHLVKPVEPDALNAVLGSVQAAKAPARN
jgi:PAS domain S-box-containing protein